MDRTGVVLFEPRHAHANFPSLPAVMPSTDLVPSPSESPVVMPPLLRTTLAVLSLLLAPQKLPAQHEPVERVSAPIAEVAYTVTFDSASAAARTLRVEMSFETWGGEPVLLAMPRWTPGAYELSEFARYVRGFEVHATDGRALVWSKLDPHSWSVLPPDTLRGRVTISYDVVADTLDTAMAWSRQDVAMFNGTAVFLYPVGQRPEFPSTVRIRTVSGWRVATGMTPRAEREYGASDYHELVDMPFLIGRFDLDSMRILDRWFRLATYPEGSVAGPVRAQTWEQLRRMVPPIVQVWGDIPFGSYTILQVAHETFGGASGLEHANSHVNIVSPYAIGHPFLPSLYAHEIFHAWNVKRLRPVEMWPYRYDRAQWTALLWMSEGVTDYYADLALVRGGVISRSGFLQATAGKIEEVLNAPPVALEDASISTWVRPVDGTGLVYYPKGSLVGLLLDIMIRDATGNRASLDAALRDLYRSTTRASAGGGSGFTSEEWWAALERSAGGVSLAEFRQRYVAGREALPYAMVLPRAALRLVVDTIREPVVGVRTLLDSDGVLVTGVEPGGAAEEAGVQAGDYLLSVGGLRVTDRDFADRFRDAWTNREGARLALRVRRGGRTMDLAGTVRLLTRYSARLEEDRDAPQAAVRIREGILRGLVTP